MGTSEVSKAGEIELDRGLCLNCDGTAFDSAEQTLRRVRQTEAIETMA